jgi:hypothetical protein
MKIILKDGMIQWCECPKHPSRLYRSNMPAMIVQNGEAVWMGGRLHCQTLSPRGQHEESRESAVVQPG